MEILTIGHKVRVMVGEFKGKEGIVLNPREVYGMFERGALPVKLEGIDEPIAFVPQAVIRVPIGRLFD
jgi:hypothetical protein